MATVGVPHTNVGSNFSIAEIDTPLVGFTQIEFESFDWKKVGEVAAVPAYGTQQELVNWFSIEGPDPIRLKGNSVMGDTTLQFASIIGDPGQELMFVAAENQTNTNYAFRITTQDGTSVYMIGVVAGYKNDGGAGNAVETISSNIGFTVHPGTGKKLLRVRP